MSEANKQLGTCEAENGQIPHLKDEYARGTKNGLCINWKPRASPASDPPAQPERPEPTCGHRFTAVGSVKLKIPTELVEPPCSLPANHKGQHQSADGGKWGLPERPSEPSEARPDYAKIIAEDDATLAKMHKEHQWRTVICGLPIIRKLLNGEEVTLETFKVNLIPDDVLFNANKRFALAPRAAVSEPSEATTAFMAQGEQAGTGYRDILEKAASVAEKFIVQSEACRHGASHADECARCDMEWAYTLGQLPDAIRALAAPRASSGGERSK